jgi:hypothetical protein
VAKGLKGVVWLGAWINAPTCGFEDDDAKIRSLVTPIAGNPAILAYYLGDEPLVTQCPDAPAMFTQRTALVHSLDPGSKTFTVIQQYEGKVARDYAPWAGAVDILGFDIYPCSQTQPKCDYTAIDSAIRSISAAGITDYWAVIQDFQDCFYRLPTPSELGSEFDHWAASGMSGYFVFSWNYQSSDSTCRGTSLDTHADNVAVLKSENARTFVPRDAAPPSPTAPPKLTLLGDVLSAGWFRGGLIGAGLLLLLGLSVVAVRRRAR